MKNPYLIPAAFAMALLSSINTQLTTAFAQGNLTPSGTPAPTMKTLEQIEPRIDVAKLAGDAGSHVIISNAGSYYLSTNLAVTKTNGITIAAAGVTLDLNGFEIARISGSGGDGIRINGGSDRATVRNGTLRGFSYGINGLVAPIVKGCLFEKLAVTSCSFVGIHAGDSARVLDCRAHNNTGTGIVALDSSVISGCTVGNNQGDYGIYAGTGSTISGCTARENQGNHGIYAGLGSTIRDCTAYNNTGTGSSSYGIYGANGVTIIACTSYGNNNTNSPGIPSHGIGIYAATGSTVKDCAARSNRGDGIRVTSACLVEGNNCNANGNVGDGAGIHSTNTRNRIEANTVTDNDRGIDVESTASLIIRNSASNNGTNYVITANNKVGVIVSAPNSIAISGSTGGAGVGSTDPWANFTH